MDGASHNVAVHLHPWQRYFLLAAFVWTLGVGVRTWHNWPRAARPTVRASSTAVMVQQRAMRVHAARTALLWWLLPSVGAYAAGASIRRLYSFAERTANPV